MIKNRPIILISTAYLLGIIIAGFMPVRAAILLIIELLIISLIIFFTKKAKRYTNYLFIAAFLILGAFIFIINENIYEKAIKTDSYKEIKITGIIKSPIIKENNLISFNILPDDRKIFLNKNILIQIHNISSKTKNKYKYGQLIECSGYYKPLKYLDKSQEYYYKSKNIQGLLYIKNENTIGIKSESNSGKFTKMIIKLKEKLTDIQNKTLPKIHAQLLNGLVFGSTSSSLNKEIKKSFLNTGLIHLLVVSGAQVSIIISLILMLNKFLKFNRFITFIIISFFNFSFAILTGSEPSILRASIMAETMLISEALKRPYDSLTSLSTVAFLLTLLNPYIVFNISFQLSFIATISMVYGVPIISQKLKLYFPDYVSYILAISIAPSFMTFPIIGYYFNRISVISILSNILVLPWIEILVILGFIASIIGQISILLAQLINNFNSILISMLLFITNNLNKISWATININHPQLYHVIALYIFILYLFEKMKLSIKQNAIKIFSAFLITLNLIIWPNALINVRDSAAFQKTNQLEVTFLDVGQGDSIFIKAPSGRNTLIDGGPKTRDIDYTREVVYKYLKKNHIKKIDVLILSHAHADHLGNLRYIIEKIPVGIVLDPGLPHTSYLYKNFLKTIKIKKIPYRRARQGQKLDYLDGIKGYIIHPKEPFISGSKSDLNNNCIVLKLVHNKTSFIFLGDLEFEGEEKLLENNSLHADIIKIAHHGSRNANSEKLLSSINPKIAVISLAKSNSYGYPHKEIIKRLKEKNIKIYRTDLNGTITIFSDGNQFSIKTER